MAIRLALYVSYVLGLIACTAIIATVAAPVALAALFSMDWPSKAPHVSLVEQRQIAAAHPPFVAEAPLMEPVRALSAPGVAAGTLAAELDSAESSETSSEKPKSRWHSRGDLRCGRSCRIALERRLDNLE